MPDTLRREPLIKLRAAEALASINAIAPPVDLYATSMGDKSGFSSWTYDENGQVVAESRTQGTVTKTAGYAYYPDGLLSAITTFGGGTSSLAYDDALRLATQSDPNDGGRNITYAYDTRSRRSAISYPSGVAQRTSYDKAGRVTRLLLEKGDGTDLQRLDYYYGFNASGVRQADYAKGHAVRLTELDGAVTSYTYDALDRVAGATRTGSYAFSQSYSYDLANNRTGVTADGVTTSASYDAANQLTSLDGHPYSYDRKGNLVSFESPDGRSNSLTYDAADKWVGARLAPTNFNFSFSYDGLGRRTSSGSMSFTTSHWYDSTGLTLDTTSSGGSTSFLRDPDGLALSLASGGSVSDYARDRLGSITGLTDSTGALTDSYRYDPWGGNLASSGSSGNPLRYVGGYLDGSSGLYLLGLRYYQPSAGRFTQLDPHPKQLLSVNRYAYSGCNPVNYSDPTGLSHCGSFGEWFWLTVRDLLILGGITLALLWISTIPETGLASIAALPAVIGAEYSLAGYVIFAQERANDCATS